MSFCFLLLVLLFIIYSLLLCLLWYFLIMWFYYVHISYFYHVYYVLYYVFMFLLCLLFYVFVLFVLFTWIKKPKANPTYMEQPTQTPYPFSLCSCLIFFLSMPSHTPIFSHQLALHHKHPTCFTPWTTHFPYTINTPLDSHHEQPTCLSPWEPRPFTPDLPLLHIHSESHH